MNSYGYDAANRLTAFTGPDLNASFGYNGLGDRLQQTVNDVPANYALDINADLTQVLEDGTNSYLYGINRLAQTSAADEYFLADALGTVRQVTDTSAAVALSRAYEPYRGLAALAGIETSRYGFTGEEQDATTLVYLRARYYQPEIAGFITRDPRIPETRGSLAWNRYTYGNSNPTQYTDPTGHEPLRRGYLEGISYTGGLGTGDITGREIVYDYASMSRARFTYSGQVGGLFASIGVAAYVGQALGFNFEKAMPIPSASGGKLAILDDYSGPFTGGYAGADWLPIPGPWPSPGAGAGYFQSSPGPIKGVFTYISLGRGLLPGELVGFHTEYKVDIASMPGAERTGVEYYFDPKTGHVDRARLISDILRGDHSPVLGGLSPIAGLMSMFGSERSGQITVILVASHAFEEYYRLQSLASCGPGTRIQ